VFGSAFIFGLRLLIISGGYVGNRVLLVINMKASLIINMKALLVYMKDFLVYMKVLLVY